MSIDDYLQQFGTHRVTLIGPMSVAADVLGLQERELQEPLIWVDGGINHRRGKAGFSIGDGDSCAWKLDQYLETDKDYSDLAYTLNRLSKQFTDILLLGFLGGRRDHELFNLGEAHSFLCAASVPTRIRFDSGIDGYSKGEWAFHVYTLFSLWVLEAATVKLVGACKYQLRTPTEIAPLSSLGLSNIGTGEINLLTTGPAFIFKPESIDQS